MHRRRRRRRTQNDVELNLAAMLDMAFQLLTFFILTFKPAPIEGEVALRLPPPKPVTVIKEGRAAGSDVSDINPVAGVNTLAVSVFPNRAGAIESLAIGEAPIANVGQLETRLKAVLGDPGNPFDQVIIQVGSDLHYDELMRVIDVCTKQTLPSGEKLTKLSFVELPGGSAGQ
jgi:biopolymer transport protein ExbD